MLKWNRDREMEGKQLSKALTFPTSIVSFFLLQNCIIFILKLDVAKLNIPETN